MTRVEEDRIIATLGEPKGEKWEAAIVIQGPRVPGITATIIKEHIERNDTRVLLIVSTYLQEEELQGDACIGDSLSEHEKQYLEQGRIVYLYIRYPEKDLFPDFWRTNRRNQNLQRLSSFVGLRYAHELGIEWVLKCRADSFFATKDVCFHLLEMLKSSPPISYREGSGLDRSKLQTRIIINDYYNIMSAWVGPLYMGPNHLSDIWLFGKTTDIMVFFDMRKGCQWDEGRGIEQFHTPENNLWDLWMREVGVREEIKIIKEVLGRYLIVADSADIGYVFMKRQTMNKFLTQKKGYLRRVQKDLCGLVILYHTQWTEIAKKYSLPSLGV